MLGNTQALHSCHQISLLGEWREVNIISSDREMTDKSVAVLLKLWALEIGMTSQKYTASKHIKLCKDPTNRKNIWTSCRQDGAYIHSWSEDPTTPGRQLVVSRAVVSVCGPGCCSWSQFVDTSRLFLADSVLNQQHSQLVREITVQPKESVQEKRNRIEQGKPPESVAVTSMISPV